jgi:hypothetical protein
MRRWRELVTDRTKWRDIVRQAKAHSGLKRQWKKKKKIQRRRRRERRRSLSLTLAAVCCPKVFPAKKSVRILTTYPVQRSVLNSGAPAILWEPQKLTISQTKVTPSPFGTDIFLKL